MRLFTYSNSWFGGSNNEFLPKPEFYKSNLSCEVNLNKFSWVDFSALDGQYNLVPTGVYDKTFNESDLSALSVVDIACCHHLPLGVKTFKQDHRLYWTHLAKHHLKKMMAARNEAYEYQSLIDGYVTTNPLEPTPEHWIDIVKRATKTQATQQAMFLFAIRERRLQRSMINSDHKTQTVNMVVKTLYQLKSTLKHCDNLYFYNCAIDYIESSLNKVQCDLGVSTPFYNYEPNDIHSLFNDIDALIAALTEQCNTRYNNDLLVGIYRTMFEPDYSFIIKIQPLFDKAPNGERLKNSFHLSSLAMRKELFDY